MKLAILLVLTLAGCATRPMDPELRSALIQHAVNNIGVRPLPNNYPQTRNYNCYTSGNYTHCSGN